MKSKLFISSSSELSKITNETLQNPIENVLVIGLGASVLNSRSLSAFADVTKNLIFLDSIEQSVIDKTIKHLSKDSTVMVAISKSGSTDETILILQYIEKTPLKNSKLYLVSENPDSLLISTGKELSSDYKFIEYEKSISGRFSIFLNASLLPLHLAGADIYKIVDIAKNYNDNLSYQTLANSLLSHYRKNRNILVLSVYQNSLIGFAEWVRQIVAESLGKDNFGLTTLISRGTIDEHSQLQLYLDGPDDKIYYLLPFFRENKGGIDQSLINHMESFNKAIEERKRPCLYSILNSKNSLNTKIEYGINTICKWLLAIEFIAHQQKINPFDQPAIEKAKNYFTEKSEIK